MYSKSGTDQSLAGSYTFSTGFTGVNWVTVKGVAFKQDGEVITDKVWFNIDNMGPYIDVEPRNLSGVSSLERITVRIAEGDRTRASTTTGLRSHCGTETAPWFRSLVLRTTARERIRLRSYGHRLSVRIR